MTPYESKSKMKMENYYLFENYFSIIMVYYLPQSAHIFTYAGNKQSGRIVSFCNLVHKKLKDINLLENTYLCLNMREKGLSNL